MSNDEKVRKGQKWVVGYPGLSILYGGRDHNYKENGSGAWDLAARSWLSDFMAGPKRQLIWTSIVEL